MSTASAGAPQPAAAASCARSASCAAWLMTSIAPPDGGDEGLLGALLLFWSFSWMTSQGGKISRTVRHSAAAAFGGGGGGEDEEAGARGGVGALGPTAASGGRAWLALTDERSEVARRAGWPAVRPIESSTSTAWANGNPGDPCSFSALVARSEVTRPPIDGQSAIRLMDGSLSSDGEGSLTSSSSRASWRRSWRAPSPVSPRGSARASCRRPSALSPQPRSERAALSAPDAPSGASPHLP